MLLTVARFRYLRPASLCSLLLFGLNAHAQAPVLTSSSPVRNAIAAPRSTNVALTFSQPVSAASAGNIRVFSAQRGGQLVRPGGGTVSGGGTTTISFDPAADFKPGETVFVTVPATVQGTGGAATAARVQQFTTAVAGTDGGNFGGGTDLAVGAGPASVALSDVDNDSDLDLLASEVGASSGLVSVKLNNGTGTFAAAAVAASVGAVPFAMAVGDVDGDGDPDVITANFGASMAPGTTVSVRLNDGTGAFGGSQNVGVGLAPQGLALGDVDADGDLDLLTADRFSYTVSLRLNDGAGNIFSSPNISAGSHPVSIALGDIDNDGDLDLAVANGGSANGVSIRFNIGAGIFSGLQSIGVGVAPVAVVMGDVDGDGDLDLLTANYHTIGTIKRTINDGTGIFSGTQEVSVGRFPNHISLSDIDADGDLDLLTANFYGNSVSVRLNDGYGIFSGTTDYSTELGAAAVALGDIDGDGDLDFAATSLDDNTISIRLNGGTAPQLATPSDANSSPYSLYPNPAAPGAAIRLTGAPAHQPIAVLDLAGRRLATVQTDANGTATLPAAALPSGLYLVRAADGRTRRLVVE